MMHLQVFSASIVICAAWFSSPAIAQGVSPAISAANDAVRVDFARDGEVHSPLEVAAKYKKACDLGYEPACRADSWRGTNDLPSLAQARDFFEGRCGPADPVACVVVGWAIEAEPIPGSVTGEARARAMDERLAAAHPRYVTACDTGFAAACHELARYSLERYKLGLGDPQLLAQRERGARAVFDLAGCKKGFQPSCVALGTMLPQEPGTRNKPGTAAHLYANACKSELLEGCYRLELLEASGRAVEDSRMAFDDLCARGHTASCSWLARSYPPNTQESIDTWQRACLLRDTQGCQIAGQAIDASSPAQALAVHKMGCSLGDGASCGRLGVLLVNQGQDADALGALDAGCAVGVVEACIKAGVMRMEGRKVESDPVRARRDLEKGCPDDGVQDSDACYALGRIWEDGFGIDRNRATAARYYRSACAKGHRQACFRVGESVRALQRASQSDQMLEWALDGYVRACEGGIQQACLPAADLLAGGPPNVRDPNQAKARYKILCERNEDPMACRRLGSLLTERSTQAQDLEAAREAYARGMELGDTESARMLGKMLWYGKGGPVQRSQARKVFRQACRDGNTSACGGVRQPDFGRP
jgi:TPR repeat protein